jgi:hypothetical protein
MELSDSAQEAVAKLVKKCSVCEGDMFEVLNSYGWPMHPSDPDHFGFEIEVECLNCRMLVYMRVRRAPISLLDTE